MLDVQQTARLEPCGQVRAVQFTSCASQSSGGAGCVRTDQMAVCYIESLLVGSAAGAASVWTGSTLAAGASTAAGTTVLFGRNLNIFVHHFNKADSFPLWKFRIEISQNHVSKTGNREQLTFYRCEYFHVMFLLVRITLPLWPLFERLRKADGRLYA